MEPGTKIQKANEITIKVEKTLLEIKTVDQSGEESSSKIKTRRKKEDCSLESRYTYSLHHCAQASSGGAQAG